MMNTKLRFVKGKSLLAQISLINGISFNLNVWLCAAGLGASFNYLRTIIPTIARTPLYTSMSWGIILAGKCKPRTSSDTECSDPTKQQR
jgi:hypothetical protein